MIKYNEDMFVNGVLDARIIDGELSERAKAPITSDISCLTAKCDALTAHIEALQQKAGALTDAYNRATEVINDLICRIEALEANYDPTLIK